MVQDLPPLREHRPGLRRRCLKPLLPFPVVPDAGLEVLDVQVCGFHQVVEPVQPALHLLSARRRKVPAVDLQRVVVPIASVAEIARDAWRVAHGGVVERVRGPDKPQGFQSIPHGLGRQRIGVAAVLCLVMPQRLVERVEAAFSHPIQGISPPGIHDVGGYLQMYVVTVAPEPDRLIFIPVWGDWTDPQTTYQARFDVYPQSDLQVLQLLTHFLTCVLNNRHDPCILDEVWVGSISFQGCPKLLLRRGFQGGGLTDDDGDPYLPFVPWLTGLVGTLGESQLVWPLESLPLGGIL